MVTFFTTVHLDIIKVLLPTDAQENRFKRNIKIYIKAAPTCFGVITIVSLLKLQLLKQSIKYIVVVNLVV
jgi:hypothetical protein